MIDYQPINIWPITTINFYYNISYFVEMLKVQTRLNYLPNRQNDVKDLKFFVLKKHVSVKI